MRPINVFIGYDPAESIAYHVAVQSIMDNTKHPNVRITPLNSAILKRARIYERKREPTQSTEFSFTRFLVPYLSGYSGRAIFMDCDILCLADIEELWEMTDVFGREGFPAVCVAKHTYTPKTEKKHLGRVQTKYIKKNWSSVMVFNCSHYDCQKLSPWYVSKQPGLVLHQFEWTRAYRVDSFPIEWNWLVGEYPYKQDIKLAHFTIGGPWFEDTKNCDYSDLWREYYGRAVYAQDSKVKVASKSAI